MTLVRLFTFDMFVSPFQVLLSHWMYFTWTLGHIYVIHYTLATDRSQSAFCGYTVSPVKDENKCGLIYYLTYPVSYMTFFSKYLFQVTPSPTLATGATFCKAQLCSNAKRGGGNISLTIFISIYFFIFLKFYLQYISSASTAALMCKKGGR